MNKSITFIFACFLLILSDHIIIGQTSIQLEGNQKSVIALNEFVVNQKGTSNYYSDLLGKQIPFMISISLADYGYRIMWAEQIVNQSSAETQIKYRQKQKETINELLSINGANYFISGDFFLWDETSFDINIILYQVLDNGQMKEVNHYESNIYYLNELYYELNYIGTKIHLDIMNSQSSEVNKSVAVVQFNAISQANQEVDSLFGEDLAYSIYYDLKEFPKIKMIDWDIAKKEFLDSGQQNILEISNNLEADVFIDGKIDYFNSNGDYRILPRLYIKSEERSIYIPGPVKKNEDYFEVQSTYSYIINLLDELITNNGEFNNELINIFHNNNALNTLESAKNYYKNNKYEVAAILANSILKIDKDNKDAILLLAKCKTELYEYDEAFELCTSIELNNPDKTSVPFQKGLIFLYQEEYLSAANEFYKVKNINSNYPNIDYQIGLVHYYNNEYPEAIISFKEQIQQNQRDIELWRLLALCYFENGIEKTNYSDKHIEFDNAYNAAITARNLCIDEEYYETTKDIDNIIYSILSEHGTTAFYEDKYLEAVELFMKMKNVKLNEFGLDMIRLCYSNLEDFDNLKNVIKEGIDNYIYSDTIYFQQAQYLRNIKDSTGNYSKSKLSNALYYLDRYLEYNENQSIALRIKGSTYFRLDSLDKAIDLYSKAYEYEKNDQLKTSIILNIAELSIMNGNYENGLENLNKLEFTEWSIDRNINSSHCLYLYLTIATKYMLKQDINSESSILNEFLKENTLTGWSYTTFKKWLNSGSNGLNNKQKDFLSDLTIRMENRTRSY